MGSIENNFQKDSAIFIWGLIFYSILKAQFEIQILNRQRTQDLQCQGLILM